MRQDLAPIDVEFVFDNDVLAEDCGVLHAHPAADHRAPADDAPVQPGVLPDARAPQDRAALYTRTWVKRTHVIILFKFD